MNGDIFFIRWYISLGAAHACMTTNMNIQSFVTPPPAQIRPSGPFGGLVGSLKDGMTNDQLYKSHESKDKVVADWGAFGSKESRAVACLMAIGKRHLNKGLGANDMSQLYMDVNSATRRELQRNEAAARKQWAHWLLCMMTGMVHEE